MQSMLFSSFLHILSILSCGACNVAASRAINIAHAVASEYGKPPPLIVRCSRAHSSKGKIGTCVVQNPR
jgi:hypothetical protein